MSHDHTSKGVTTWQAMSTIDLSGQIAIVTGASRGIGAAIARALLLPAPMSPFADLPQRQADSAKTLALIEETGGIARALDVDVTDPEQIRDAVCPDRRRQGPARHHV